MSLVVDEGRTDRVVGKPKSGRVWKIKQTHKNCGMVDVKPLKSSWTEKTEKRNREKALRRKVLEIRAVHDDDRKELKRKTEQKRKQREENRRKSEVTQIITNPAKLKKMSKKQIKALRRS